jgi:excisionase family DNA binding protein
MKEKNPLFTLTIGEFSDLIREIVNDELQNHKEPAVVKEKDIHFTLDELAEFLRCSRVSIHKYKKMGLPFYRLGRKVLFKKSEVLVFLKEKTRHVVINKD